MVEQVDIELDCCTNTSKTNPKTDLRRKGSKGFSLYNLQNPIADEIEDSQELKQVFSEFNLVPFAGTNTGTGDSLLAWYNMLAKLSPSTNACINKKNKYAFGSKARFISGTDYEYDFEEESVELSIEQKKAYADALKRHVVFKDKSVQGFHKKIGSTLQANGNAFVELTFNTTNGQTVVVLNVHKTAHVKYVNTAKGAAKVVAISPIWTTNYLRKSPPRLVPIYPLFSNNKENGTVHTMFHLKDGENEWYGRPESEGADLYKYREVQDALYLIKQAAGNFTGQLVIEVEDDDADANPALDNEGAAGAGFSNFTERFEQNYTQKGDDPQSVLITARPYGSKPMFVFQVKPNTNENWYRVTGKISKDYIRQSFGVTARFMGDDVAGGFSQDQFVSDYVMNVSPSINDLKETVLKFTNDILNVVWKEIVGIDMGGICITFNSPIQDSIDSIKEGSQQQ